MCWGLKWVLATLITGQDIIGDAIHQAGVRTTADTWHGMELSWGNIFRFVGGYIKPARAVVAGGAGGYFVHCGAFCFACAIRKLCCARCPLALPP